MTSPNEHKPKDTEVSAADRAYNDWVNAGIINTRPKEASGFVGNAPTDEQSGVDRFRRSIDSPGITIAAVVGVIALQIYGIALASGNSDEQVAPEKIVACATVPNPKSSEDYIKALSAIGVTDASDQTNLIVFGPEPGPKSEICLTQGANGGTDVIGR